MRKISVKYRLSDKIYKALFLLALVIFTGTAGYMTIEGYGLVDAFYMTIITISTVGFSEVQELSLNGRLFTSFLIIFSFGTFAYAISSITRYILGGEYKEYLRNYNMNKSLEEIDNHVIVCGYGRVGTQAVKELQSFKRPFVVIERSEDLIQKFSQDLTITYLKGNATNDEDLLKAGINKAKALITTLPSDADNLFVVLTARELNPKLKIITRASKSTSVKKLRIAGADNVIMPDSLGGAHMASLVVTPNVMEFLDHIRISGASEVNIEEINFHEIPDAKKHRTIGNLNACYNTGCNIIGYRSAEGDYVVNPAPETPLEEGSALFVLGTPQQIKLLNDIFNFS